MKYKLSTQAINAIMMALQKGIMEQKDITGILKGFDVLDSADGLIINNPPTVFFEEATADEVTATKTLKKKARSTKKKTTKKKATAKKDTLDA